MKNRRDFYKYNVILAITAFFMLLLHIENPSITNARTSVSTEALPNFSPTRYVATTQKARQEIYISLSPQKVDASNFYNIQAFVESSSLGNQSLNYRWVLAPGQELLSGQLAGTLIPEQNGPLTIRVKADEKLPTSRIRIEIFMESNGAKIGNVKSADLKTAPLESFAQEEAQLQAQNKINSATKSKKQIIEESLTKHPQQKIMQ